MAHGIDESDVMSDVAAFRLSKPYHDANEDGETMTLTLPGMQLLLSPLIIILTPKRSPPIVQVASGISTTVIGHDFVVLDLHVHSQTSSLLAFPPLNPPACNFWDSLRQTLKKNGRKT
ncbi:hypothetical protein ONZ45_g14597 [Pleurotus djamor]|nr:hypothetical protein ONZ45_g14597 [Pleurotus djamor]